MSAFLFEGTIYITLKNSKVFNLYGKIVDSENGKDRKVHLIFDENTEDDKQQFEQLKMLFTMYALTEDPTMVATFESDGLLLTTIIDARYFYNEKWDIVSLIQNPIISCLEIGKEQDLSLIEFTGIKFRLESNKNIRKVLTKQFNINNESWKYSEKGNQYTREVTVNFIEHQNLAECQSLIKTIVQSRTFIDGFQNYESNIILLKGEETIVYNYLSRRIVDKFRWYKSGRLNIEDTNLYSALICQFLKHNSINVENRATEATINVCEYLHQPNFSLPTSKFIEIITSFEGYAKFSYNNKILTDKDVKWVKLLEKLEEVVNNSEYDFKEKKQIKKRLKIANPYEEKLALFLSRLFSVSLEAVNYEISEAERLLLIKNIVSIRNILSHNPAEYFDSDYSKDNQIITVTCLLRELIIVAIIKEPGSYDESLSHMLSEATDLQQYIYKLCKSLLTIMK